MDYDSDDTDSLGSIDYPDEDYLDFFHVDPVLYSAPSSPYRSRYAVRDREVLKTKFISCRDVRPTEECAICLEGLKGDAEYCQHGCGNQFHRTCVSSIRRCPLCRIEPFVRAPVKQVLFQRKFLTPVIVLPTQSAH